MSDDNVVPLGRKVFRRKRKFQGATWTPTRQSADPDDGVWCPSHRIRHGYMSINLQTKYEKGSDGRWKILWICKLTGNVLREDGLGSVRVPEGGCGPTRTDRERFDWFRDGDIQ